MHTITFLDVYCFISRKIHDIMPVFRFKHRSVSDIKYEDLPTLCNMKGNQEYKWYGLIIIPPQSCSILVLHVLFKTDLLVTRIGM